MISRKEVHKRNILFGFNILWLGVFLFSLTLIYDLTTELKGYTEKQEVSFSHKTHSGKFKIKCLHCHYQTEVSKLGNIPETFNCMVCHAGLDTKPDELKKVFLSDEEISPIEWEAIYKLPDYVRFNHSSHIKAQIDCSSCHGKVEEMDSVYIEQNITMNWCLDCHEDPGSKITFARDISGIYTNSDSAGYFQSLPEENSEEVNKPNFGDYYSNNINKPNFNFYSPMLMIFGPKSCGSCHY